MIWGTDVNVQETKKKFKEFLETFVLEGVEGTTQTDKVEPPLYMTRLDEVRYKRSMVSQLSTHKDIIQSNQLSD